MNGQYIAGKRLTCCTAEKGETTVLTSKSIVPLLMLRNINFENILTICLEPTDFPLST